MSDAKAEKTLADPQKFQALINDPHLRAQFDRNLKLIRFKTGLHDGISYVYPTTNLDEARQVFRNYKFFSMVNDTAWKNYTKTFASLL